MTELRSTAHWLHGLGANITAIERQSKGPAHQWDHWQAHRQQLSDVNALPWKGYIVRKETKRHKPGDEVKIGAIGIVNGISGWHTFDLDARKDVAGSEVSDATVDRLLRSLGLPHTYPWVWRSGSGKGWEVAIRCEEAMPAGALTNDKYDAGVFTGWPVDDTEDWHHLELRWENCQTIVLCNDGRAYAWRHEAPTEPPALLPIRRIIAAFFDLAPPPAHNLGTIDRGVVEQVRSRFDLVAYAQKELGGELEHEGVETRVLGHQGFLVNSEKGVWYIHGEEIGGDAFDLVAYCKYRTTARNLNGKSAEILAAAAEYAGVTIPSRKDEIVSAVIELGPVVKQVELVTTPKAPIDINDLLEMERKPTLWYAPGFLREGLGLLVGQPNVGKTPLAAQLAIAIATGAKWMGNVQTQQAKVLYLGMEYSAQELIPLFDISRCGVTIPRGQLLIKTIEDDFPTTAEDALMELEWYIRVLGVGVIIIDVLTAFLPPEKFKQNIYRGDYSELKPYHKLALQYNASILGVWHASKREADPKLMYNGSTGMWAAAASRITMYQDLEQRVRIASFARMADKVDWALAQERTLTGRRWIVADANPEPICSPTELQIFRFLKGNTDKSKMIGPSTIAEMTNIPLGSIKTLLLRMYEKNLIQRGKDGYFVETVVADVADVASVADVTPVADVAEQMSGYKATERLQKRLHELKASGSAKPDTGYKATTATGDLENHPFWDAVPRSHQTGLWVFLRSNIESDQERAREICAEYGVDYATALKLVPPIRQRQS